MASICEAQVFDGHLTLAYGADKLFGFANRHMGIVRAMDDEKWRCDLPDAA
jgi:hypothetical protein